MMHALREEPSRLFGRKGVSAIEGPPIMCEMFVVYAVCVGNNDTHREHFTESTSALSHDVGAYSTLMSTVTG